jgi:GrpB-like predicted nucleotidyltransferase (UPF0157 family)
MAFMRNIVIVPYDASWPARFQKEAQRLRAALGPIVLDLQHVGSTSVPGLDAKPLLDIMLVVTDLAALDERNQDMIALGYEPQGALFVPNSRFFAKGGDASRTHHIHSYPPGHSEIARHLDFRDFLRCHPEEARQYAELKKQLAEAHRDDLPAYNDGKTPLIRALTERAHQWRASGASG